VRVSGDGGITADTNFAVRITQGKLNLKSTASPVTFSSNLGPKGASTQTFAVAGGTSGTATVTLATVFPSTTIGFGVGLWRPDTAACSLTQVINSSGGGQLSLGVDQGIYCVRVFDLNTLTNFVNFSISINHP